MSKYGGLKKSRGVKMGILESNVLKGFVRLCDDGWRQGWHERNGGNLTYRMRKEEVEECKPYFTYDRPWVNMGVQADNLAGEYFMSTGTGKYFRNMSLAPEENLCIVEINDKGDSYRIVWGLTKGGGPTSEFPSHFLNHSVKTAETNGEARVIYHAHPTNIIALTFVLPLTDSAFSKVLWQSMTECPVVFPKGVGVVEWMIPGGAEIALKTSELMKKYDAVVWAHHGLFVMGNDFDSAFGLMHTIEKSAEIYVTMLSTGLPMLQTIPEDKLADVAKAYGGKLAENLL